MRTISHTWLLLMLTFCCHPKTFSFLNWRTDMKCLEYHSKVFVFYWEEFWAGECQGNEANQTHARRVLCEIFLKETDWLTSLQTPPVRQTSSYHLWNFNAGYPAWLRMAQCIPWTEFQQFIGGLVLKMVTKRHFRSLNNGAEINFST